MYQKALSIYYVLVMFVIGTGLFVLQPTDIPQVAAWQDGVKHQLSVAWRQTVGDGPWFEEVGTIFDGVTAFYEKSADTTIAMVRQPELDADLYYVFHEVYKDFALSLSHNHKIAGATIAIDQPLMPSDFMAQEPLYNIVPYNNPKVSSVQTNIIKTDSMASTISVLGQPVNSSDLPWVTLQDNATGQLYCLAVYNGTVNKYLGPCKNDYQ